MVAALAGDAAAIEPTSTLEKRRVETIVRRPLNLNDAPYVLGSHPEPIGGRGFFGGSATPITRR
jgi:hypothetical protein